MRVASRLPINKINNIKGETLVIVGEQDKTVDFNNGWYFYHSLKNQGKKVEYLTYKNDWHQMRNPET
jgi:dipeptidyl aminopeptidase/acylaminoacyl peptidase